MTRRSHAFGLDLTLPLAVRGLPPRDPVPGLPRLAVTVGGAPDADRAWGARDAQLLVSGPGLVVEAADGAYRLDWHGVGVFVLPGDGRLVCTAESGGGERWERVLLAQVLPLAATVAGVEVEASCPFTQGLEAGRIVEIEVQPTIADGLAGNLDPDTITFDIVRRRVSQIVVVSEAQLREAIAGIVTNEQLVTEGAGAVGVAAVMAGKLDVAGKRVAIVLSGANIDQEKLKGII